MTVRIQSFSYKRGIPLDEKGHGGGFVFDCRFLPNPGRYQEFQNLTGNDEPVIEFLQKEPDAKEFSANINSLIDKVIKNYKDRNFTDVMIAFGCTGGQHRSVYFANQLSEYLNKNQDVDVEIRHREQELK